MPGRLDLVNILGYPTSMLIILGRLDTRRHGGVAGAGRTAAQGVAYAGVFFNMTGATASHAFAGDYGDYVFDIVVTPELRGAGGAVAEAAAVAH